MLDPGDRRAMVAAALLAGAAAALTLGWAEAPLVAGLGGLCLAVVRIDGQRFLIPDVLTISVAALGVFDLAFVGPGQILFRVTATLVLVLALWLLRAALSWWKGRTAMGLGDVKFLAAAALWLPVVALPSYVFLAATSGLIELVLRRPKGGRIAFGRHLAPWLCLCVVGRPWIEAIPGLT